MGWTDWWRDWTYFWTFLDLFLFLRPNVLSSTIFCFFAVSAFDCRFGGISYYHQMALCTYLPAIDWLILLKGSSVVDLICIYSCMMSWNWEIEEDRFRFVYLLLLTMMIEVLGSSMDLYVSNRWVDDIWNDLETLLLYYGW